MFWAELDAAWNARTAGHFSELLAIDGNLEFIDRGYRLEGRQAIHEHFVQQFSKQSPHLIHRTVVRNIRSVPHEGYALDGMVMVMRNPASQGKESAVSRTFAIFSVMLKVDAGWEIRERRAYALPTP